MPVFFISQILYTFVFLTFVKKVNNVPEFNSTLLMIGTTIVSFFAFIISVLILTCIRKKTLDNSFSYDSDIMDSDENDEDTIVLKDILEYRASFNPLGLI